MGCKGAPLWEHSSGSHSWNRDIFAYRRARAPLPAAAHVDPGVKVVITKRHLNGTAGSGCHGATCSPSFFRLLGQFTEETKTAIPAIPPVIAYPIA